MRPRSACLTIPEDELEGVGAVVVEAEECIIAFLGHRFGAEHVFCREEARAFSPEDSAETLYFPSAFVIRYSHAYSD